MVHWHVGYFVAGSHPSAATGRWSSATCAGWRHRIECSCFWRGATPRSIWRSLRN